MLFDLSKIDPGNGYKLLSATVVPRPIAWVTSLNANGILNAAPFSFFNALSGTPPVVAIGVSSRPDGVRKDTGLNIEAMHEWVVNLVPQDLAEAMNITAIDFPTGISEVEQAGLETVPSLRVKPPRLAGSPAALECKLMQTIDLGPERVILLGEVLAVYVRDDAVMNAERCHIDTPKLELIGRMGGLGGYVRTTDRFEMPRIPLAEWKK